MATNENQNQELTQYAGRGQTLATNAARTAAIVGNVAREMAMVNSGDKIPLKNLELVKEAALNYLRTCAETGTLPTVRGCAAWCGVTRGAFYEYGRNHPEFQSWLESFSDICAEVLMQSALEGTSAAVPAIFVCKSRYGWKENEEPQLKDDALPKRDVKEIIEKYADILPDD